MEKQYDWFATRIFQPEMSIDELFDQGITPENTGFKTREDYKNIASVREQFIDSEGLFDEDAFNRAYNSSREMYNMYVNKEYNKKLLEEFAYDPYEWYAPATAETIDVAASNAVTSNGMFYSTNIGGIGEDTESPYSVREIAQQQLVHDENGNQLDWTPEDKGGLLKGMFRDPLVLATYDEDTPEYDEDGNLITIHKKGDYKLNEFGAPYYEMLGDRDAYGKEMLHYSDTFTREGTILNKLDFYDSDDKKKSVFGTAMKTAAQILPMFLPGPAKYAWGAINAAKGIGQSMAALGKGLDSIITGSDDNEFGRNLTKMENWLARFDTSKSDYGNQHMWTSAETYGDLIGSTVKQLFEQRVVASIPQHLKFLGKNIQRSKMGQNMAIAYMAATSAKESYQAGIEAGLGDRQAGLLLMASTAAMWKLMDSDYGRSTLFKGSWFDDDIAKKTAKETAEQMVKSGDRMYLMSDVNESLAKHGTTRGVKMSEEFIEEATKQGKTIKDLGKRLAANKKAAVQATKQAAKEEAKQKTAQAVGEAVEAKKDTLLHTSRKFLKEAYDKFSKNLKDKLDVFTGLEWDEYAMAMLREGVEETAEEGISDALKATTLALESLGVKMNDTGQKLDYGFSGKDIFDRYLLSFIGGAVGGGIFRGYTEYENYIANNKQRKVPNYQRDLIRLIADGRGKELIQEYKRLYNKGLLGSSDLKSSFKMSADEFSDIAGEGEMTQADANLKILTGNVRFIEQILTDEGLFDAIKQTKEKNIVEARNKIWNQNNDQLTEQQKRGEFLMLHKIGAHQLMTHSFLKLAEDFVTAKTWLVGVNDDLRKKDNLTADEKAELDKNNKIYEERIKELRKQRDELLDGKYNGEFASSILLETEGVLQKILKVGKLDKNGWALSMYGKTYNALNKLERVQVDKDIDWYNNESVIFYGRKFTEAHDGAKRTYLELQRRMRSQFEKQNEALKGQRFNNYHADNYFGAEFFKSMVDIGTDQTILKRLNYDMAVLDQQEQTPKVQEDKAKLAEEIRHYEDKLRQDEKRLENYRYKNGMKSEGENTENLIPTNMLLKRFKDNDAAFEKLITTYRDIIQSPDVSELVPDVLEQVLSIYTNIKKDGGLVQDFGELKLAEQALLNFIDKLKQGLFVYEEAEADIINGNSTNHVIQNTLLGEDATKRIEFEKHLDGLKEALIKSNYEEAKSYYEKMQAIVLDTVNTLKTNGKEYLQNLSDDSYGATSAEEYLAFFENAFYFPKSAPYHDLKNPFDIFFKIVELTKEINKSPVSQILEEFTTKVENKPELNKVKHYIENIFSEYASTKSWTDFFIANEDEQTLLKELMDVIELMDLMISTDKQTIDAMNVFYDKDSQLVSFDPIAQRNLLKGLDAIKEKIYLVYCNGKYNSRNRHSEIEKDAKIQTINDVQNLVKFWGDIPEDERKKEFDPKAIWEQTIARTQQDQWKYEDFIKLDPNTLTDDQFKELYRNIKIFEQEVYSQWQTFTKDNKDIKSIAKTFVGLFEKHPGFTNILLEREQNPYDKHSMAAITPIETFKYLLSLISINGIALDAAYKQALENFAPSESETTIIPNDEQERANKFAVSYFNHPELWNAVRFALLDKLDTFKTDDAEEREIADFIKNRKTLVNTLLIPGACGVGKSTMVGKILYYLWGGSRKGIISAPKSKTAEDIAKHFPKDSGFEVIGGFEDGKEVDAKEKLFKFLFGDAATNKFEFTAKDDVATIDRSKYPFLDNISEAKLKELKEYKVILLDEVGQYNEIELRLIDEVAQKAGIYVIGLGDHCQMGDIIKLDDGRLSNSNYQDLNVWKTPYLVRSMRNTSLAKGVNNANLGRRMWMIESMFYKEDGKVSDMIVDKSFKDGDIEVKLLYSSLLESGICGDRIDTTEDSFKQVVDHIIETKKDGQTISVVINEAPDSTVKKTEWETRFKKLGWKEGKDYFIKNIAKNEINGYETTYTIVDVDWDERIKNKGAKTVWKEFYTISQRSHMASVFLDKTDSLKTIHITSEFDKDAHRVWSNDASFVRQWYDHRTSWFMNTDITTAWFENETSAFATNHDSPDEEKKREKDVELLPSLDDVEKEAGVVTDAEESADDKKRRLLNEQIARETQELQNSIATVKNELKNKGFYIKDDNVESLELVDIDSMKLDDCDKHLTIINKCLTEIGKIDSKVTTVKTDAKKAVQSELDVLGKYKNFLLDKKNLLEKRHNEIIKSAITPDDVYKSIKDGLEQVDRLDDIGDKSTNIATQIDALEQIEKIFSTIIADLNKLNSDVYDALDKTKIFSEADLELVESELVEPGFAKTDIKTIFGSLLKTVQAALNEQKKQFEEKVKTFKTERPEKLSSDDFESVDKYSDLSTTEKNDVVAKIQSAINDYNKALKELDDYKDDLDLKESVDVRRDAWTNRIVELESLIAKINSSIKPETNANYEEAKRLYDAVRTILEDCKSGTNSLENAITLLNEVIDFANKALEEDLSDSERAIVNKMIEYCTHNLEANKHFLEKETEQRLKINNETEYTRGFTVNQKTSKDAEFRLSETEKYLREAERTVQAEEVVKSKFSKLGAEQYLQLRKATETPGSYVEVWGLDLETTGVDPYIAEIAQVGLVKYKISRTGDNWKIEPISGTEINKFVQPTTADLTPPEYFDSKKPESEETPEEKEARKNPIYDAWEKATDKWTETEALNEIMRVINSETPVVTFNGRSYDMTVLKARARKLLNSGETDTTSEIIDGWNHIDIYADFAGTRESKSVRGTDLLWNETGGVRTLIGYFDDHKLSTLSNPEVIHSELCKDPDKRLPAHNAIADVHATLDLMINMFNGISTFQQSQMSEKSDYEENKMFDNIYQRDILPKFIRDSRKEGRFKDMTPDNAFWDLNTIRHRILRGDPGYTAGQKQWFYDSNTGMSTLKYVDKYSEYDGLPLLVVKGERAGVYAGTCTYTDMTFMADAVEDLPITELLKRVPSLRVSKPFVLTGLKYKDMMDLGLLNEKARKFYDPETNTYNLGKTFVLVTTDPTYEQMWDPSEALTLIKTKDGLNWRNPKFKMLTVSRNVDFQEMIDFSIATCALATDKVAGGAYMKEYFEKWKKAVSDAKNEYKNAKPEDEEAAKEKLIQAQTIAGITLSNTQYERLLEDVTDFTDRIKLFHSDVFSVMDNRNVGKFIAGFINGCMKHEDDSKLREMLSNDIHHNTVSEWVLTNLIESVRQKPWYASWVSEKYNNYYTLNLVVNGVEFKIIAHKTTEKDVKDSTKAKVNLYLIQNNGNTDIQDVVNQIENAKHSASIKTTGIKLEGDLVRKVYDNIQAYFDNKKVFGATLDASLKFDEISLKTISSPTGSTEIRQPYNVGTNEVITRAFTVWSDNSELPVTLTGWNRLFETIQEDVDGFTHGIYGHEIIDKSSSAAMDASIFSASICNNPLNGEYKAVSTKIRQYGFWTLNNDKADVDVLRATLDGHVDEIAKLGFADIKTQLEPFVEKLVQNKNNLKLTTRQLKQSLANEATKLLKIANASNLTDDNIFVNSTGDFERVTTYKETINFGGYNSKYYWVNGNKSVTAHLYYKGDEIVGLRIGQIEKGGTVVERTIKLSDNDHRTLLFKNILLSLWDKEIKIKGDKGSYLGYYVQKVLSEDKVLSDTIIEGVRNYVLTLPENQIDAIFTKEIQDLILSDESLTDDYKELRDLCTKDGFDFYTALGLVDFDLFAIIKKIC